MAPQSLLPTLDAEIPATSFALFPKLPAEFRYIIWELLLPGPRVVYLDLYSRKGFPLDGDTSDPTLPNLQDWKKHITSTVAAIHMLRILRCDAKEPLQAAFKSKNNIIGTWFSFKIDTLYLSSHSEADLDGALQKGPAAALTEVDQIQRLVLDTYSLAGSIYHAYTSLEQYRHLCQYLKNLPGLENVTIGINYTRGKRSCLTVKRLVDSPESLMQFIGFQSGDLEEDHVTDMVYDQVDVIPEDSKSIKIQNLVEGGHEVAPGVTLPRPTFGIVCRFVMDSLIAERFTKLEEANELQLAQIRERMAVRLILN